MSVAYEIHRMGTPLNRNRQQSLAFFRENPPISEQMEPVRAEIGVEALHFECPRCARRAPPAQLRGQVRNIPGAYVVDGIGNCRACRLIGPAYLRLRVKQGRVTITASPWSKSRDPAPHPPGIFRAPWRMP